MFLSHLHFSAVLRSIVEYEGAKHDMMSMHLASSVIRSIIITLLLSMHVTVEDSALLGKLLLDNPEQTVKFKVYKRDCCPEISSVDRRLTRVKNKNRLPVGVWARWVVESISFIQS